MLYFYNVIYVLFSHKCTLLSLHFPKSFVYRFPFKWKSNNWIIWGLQALSENILKILKCILWVFNQMIWDFFYLFLIAPSYVLLSDQIRVQYTKILSHTSRYYYFVLDIRRLAAQSGNEWKVTLKVRNMTASVKDY